MGQITNRVKFFIAVGIIICLWLVCRFFINIEITKQTQILQTSYEKKIYDLKVELDLDKIQTEKRLKEELLSSKTDLEKCKLEIDLSKQKQQLKQLSKNDPQKFKQKVDEELGVKERKIK